MSVAMAATKIQNLWKGAIARRQVKKQREEERERQELQNRQERDLAQEELRRQNEAERNRELAENAAAEVAAKNPALAASTRSSSSSTLCPIMSRRREVDP